MYRDLAAAAEPSAAEDAISGMPEWTKDLPGCYPIEEWRNLRRSNHRVLSTALEGIPWLKVLQPDDSTACPFAGILVFDSPERRDHVQKELIPHRVFLSIMWPLDSPAVQGIPEAHVDFSRRILCMPCDARYGGADLTKVAAMVRAAGESYRS